MPQPAFHLDLASEFLHDWTESPSNCPFDIHSNQQRDAFLHGSIAPDMGFFPGARPEIAAIAHRGPTGDLIRSMLAGSRNQIELAFTYGWASHILLDAFVHPLVNTTAASYLHDRKLGGADVHSLHIRLEIGLDLVTHRRVPALQRLRLGRVLDGRGFKFLADAHQRVHRYSIDPDDLFHAHGRVARLLGPLLGLQASMAYAWTEQGQASVSAALWSVRAGLNTLRGLVNGVTGVLSQPSAFLAPLFFDADCTATLADDIHRFRAEFQSYVSDHLGCFPNYDVDTGSIEPTQLQESAA